MRCERFNFFKQTLRWIISNFTNPALLTYVHLHRA
jgi:hypothetical protein